MSTPEEEALAAVARADGTPDWEQWKKYHEVREAARARRRKALHFEARSVHRAIEGWGTVSSQEQWIEMVNTADQGLDTGGFLLDRLGAERYVDPALTAVLLVLRRRLVEEHGATTAAEFMLIDSIVLAYYHQLRINGWIGNLGLWLEDEFFGQEKSLTAKLKGYYGADSVRGLKVEDIVHRLAEELLPLLERANRLMLRNLKALKEVKQPAPPSVNIGQARQVNVGQQQVNVQAERDGDE